MIINVDDYDNDSQRKWDNWRNNLLGFRFYGPQIDT